MDLAVPVDQFLNDRSEFNNLSGVTSPRITFWSQMAAIMLNSSRWGPLFTMAAELFIAHHLVLQLCKDGDVATGGIPGLSTGAIVSEAAASASISYDTSSTIEKDAGHWNYTDYGREFIRLAWEIGAGPLQVGTPPGHSGNMAWGGPPFYPW